MSLSVHLLADANPEWRLVIVLLQLAVIIAAARTFGFLFKKIGQPAVVGEIAAGLVLGPSVFGKLETLAGYPQHPWSHALFDPQVADVFTILSQLGLILLLFLVGLEFDLQHFKKSGHSAVAISLAGLVVPFALGLALAYALHTHLEPVDDGTGGLAPVGLQGFALFMGTALSITALPVLGRMLMEFNLLQTRLGAITLGAAAVGDAVGWIVLAAVSAVVHADYHFASSLRMAGFTLLFTLLVAFIARPLLIRWLRWTSARSGGGAELAPHAVALLLIVILLAAATTSLIGIFAIFGSFILGAALSDQRDFQKAISRQLRNFVTVFFLPIFFTYTGLHTNVDALDRPVLWAFAALIWIAAIAGKLGGCALAARATGFSWRESLCVGSLMNTRGLMELVVINVGYELHVIPRSVFCMLVLMALLTTFMTTPLLHLFKKGTELEAPMRRLPPSPQKSAPHPA